MNHIYVKEEIFNAIENDIRFPGSEGPYAAAMEAGFIGFSDGIGRVKITPKTITLTDRGISYAGRTLDNSTKFHMI